MAVGFRGTRHRAVRRSENPGVPVHAVSNYKKWSYKTGTKFECNEELEQTNISSKKKDEEIDPEMYEQASQFIADQTCLICDSNFESVAIVIRHVIAHLLSESNMGQESDTDSRTKSEIEEHDLNVLSDSESFIEEIFQN